VSARENADLEAALVAASESLRELWDPEGFPAIQPTLPLGRLSSTQLAWISSQAIFVYLATKARQSAERRVNVAELIETFTPPDPVVGSPQHLAQAELLLPLLRGFVVDRGLHDRAVGAWGKAEVCGMIALIGEAWMQLHTQLNENPDDDEPPLKEAEAVLAAANILGAG